MPSNLHDSLYGDAPAEPISALPIECAYHSKRGTPCGRIAVEGETYCVLHGASIIRAKEQIQRRMLALQEKSIQAIEDVLMVGDDKSRLAAATIVLDRTGMGPSSTINIDQKQNVANLTDEQLLQETEALASATRETIKRRRMNEALMNSPASASPPH